MCKSDWLVELLGKAHEKWKSGAWKEKRKSRAEARQEKPIIWPGLLVFSNFESFFEFRRQNWIKANKWMQETAKLLIYSVCEEKKVMKLWCDWMCQFVAMILWVNICQGWHCWLQVAHKSVLPTATYPWDYCCIWILFFLHLFVCMLHFLMHFFVYLFAGDAVVSFVYCLRSVCVCFF